LICSAEFSQFFLPRFLRSGWNHAGGVDELDLALAGGLAVGEHPDVGGDAGVVEHVQRQGDDGFQPVVLDDPAADVALALAGVAGEQGRAVVDLGDAAAQRALVWPFILAQLVDQEHELAVAGAGDEGEVRVAGVVLTTKRGSAWSFLPPMRSRSVFQLLP
jgi:hypothetical protein